MCLRLRIRTSGAITNISNRRNYSSQVLPDNYSDSSSEDYESYRNPSRRDSRESGYDSKTYSFNVQHWFKNWQEQRKNKLTASTFAGAIGFFPGRRVQLWKEKICAQEPFPGNSATWWNNFQEEEALKRYKLITGNVVTQPEFQVYGNENREDDWLGASPDGTVENIVVNRVYRLSSPGVLEIKCPSFKVDMNRGMPWERIHHYHIPQAQGLMEIMDRNWMDFYVWTPKGSNLFRLYRDQVYWQVLQMALTAFWRDHVQPAREHYSKCSITHPLNQLRFLKPAPRHELCSYIEYESECIADNSNLVAREINGQVQWLG